MIRTSDSGLFPLHVERETTSGATGELCSVWRDGMEVRALMVMTHVFTIGGMNYRLFALSFN